MVDGFSSVFQNPTKIPQQDRYRIILVAAAGIVLGKLFIYWEHFHSFFSDYRIFDYHLFNMKVFYVALFYS